LVGSKSIRWWGIGRCREGVEAGRIGGGLCWGD
jgi:hypothetical protein